MPDRPHEPGSRGIAAVKHSHRLAAAIAGVFVVAVALGALLPRLGGFGHGRGAGGLGPTIRLPSLDGAGPWVTGAIDSDSLRDHVTLVVLWSDTDPVALALLPEVQAWHLAYARYGLRVLGVHVPEFAFAADTAVASRVARRLGLTFPIVDDPAYRLASRFRRTLPRPACYVADPAGRVVFEGEGSRPDSVDRALRDQLALARPDAGIPVGPNALRDPAPRLWHHVYLGTSRAQAGPLASCDTGRPQTFTAQFRFQEEGRAFVAYPVGRWTPGAEGLTATRGGAENFLCIRGDGRSWAVLAPPPGGAARVWLLDRDAWLPRARAGSDVQFDPHGAAFVLVNEPRLYDLARCDGDCLLKLSPDAPGVAFYAFAFGPPARPGVL